MFHLIGFIVFGFIVGLVAKLLAPGQAHMSLTATTLLGIVGSLVAGWLGRGLGWYGPDDGAGFIMSTVGAILVIALYHMVARKRGISRSSTTNYPRKVA